MTSIYIPELRSLCARKIADQLRELNKRDRVLFLLSLPIEIRDMIAAFPYTYEQYLVEEGVFGFFFEFEVDEYEDICRSEYNVDVVTGKGSIQNCKKVIRRKCANYYCDNEVMGPVLLLPRYRYRKPRRTTVCDKCASQLYSIGIQAKLRKEILENL